MAVARAKKADCRGEPTAALCAHLKQGFHAEALLLLELLLERRCRHRRRALPPLAGKAAAQLWGAVLRHGSRHRLLPGGPAAQWCGGWLHGLLLCKRGPAGTYNGPFTLCCNDSFTLCRCALVALGCALVALGCALCELLSRQPSQHVLNMRRQKR